MRDKETFLTGSQKAQDEWKGRDRSGWILYKIFTRAEFEEVGTRGI
jgi:hypothetical protein